VSASPLAAPLPAALPLADPFTVLPVDGVADPLVELPVDGLADPLLDVLVDGVPHAASSSANTMIGAHHVLFLILFAPSQHISVC